MRMVIASLVLVGGISFIAWPAKAKPKPRDTSDSFILDDMAGPAVQGSTAARPAAKAPAKTAAPAVSSQAPADPAAPAARQDPPKPARDPKLQDIDWEWQDPVDFMPNAGAEAGKMYYERYCMTCHGATGKGDGPLAKHLDPKPRDFTSADTFKCRSTPSVMMPAKMDMMRAIVHGLPLSAMLSYSFLETPEEVAMMEHVKSFTRKQYWDKEKGAAVEDNPFVREGHGKPLLSGNIPQNALPVATPADLAAGALLYRKHSCQECHGETGDGKGTKPDRMKPTEAKPRDFTQGIYTGGPDVRHVYLKISLGSQGTAMPSFSDAATIDERWKLAQYVMSLSKRKGPLPLPHSEILKIKKAAALPAGPDDAAWDKLSADQKDLDDKDRELKEAIRKAIKEGKEPPQQYGAREFAILPLYFQQLKIVEGRPYYQDATVRSIHDGKSVAMLLEWDDPTENRGTDGKPPDGIEVQLSPSLQFQFVFHGQKLAKEAGETDADFQSRQLMVQTNLWRWTADKPDTAVEIDALGPFDEKAQDAKQQNVTVKSQWKAGKWRVMFVRVGPSATPADAPLTLGSVLPISFHRFDGAHGDKEFQRLITTWNRALLGE